MLGFGRGALEVGAGGWVLPGAGATVPAADEVVLDVVGTSVARSGGTAKVRQSTAAPGVVDPPDVEARPDATCCCSTGCPSGHQ